MHWNKLDWVNPMSRDEIKIHLCVFKKTYFKDNDKTTHWVGHSRLRSLDMDEFFKITQNFVMQKQMK